MDRRDFLRTSALATLGIAVACKSSPVPLVTKGGTLDEIQGDREQSIDARWSSVEVLSGRDERLTITLSKPGSKSEPLIGASGNVWIAANTTSGQAIGPFPLRPLGDGFESVGLYLATVSVPADGVYIALVDAKVANGDAQVGQTQFVVGSSNKQVKPGGRAVATPTPTVKDHRGVDPYCTQKPPCAMHAISLDDALANGKPTVMMIATPAFCESRLCGPEVAFLEQVARETGTKANFIHVEVYRDDDIETVRKRILAPAAAAWKLEIEPATYWIDANARVIDRALGPLDTQGFRDATRAFLG